MKAIDVNCAATTAAGDFHRITSLATAMGIIGVAHCSRPRKQGLTNAHQLRRSKVTDTTGREPFGFAFTKGCKAQFRVPNGHRFVIENVDIFCWAKDEHLAVQLVTKSSQRVYRNLTPARWPGQPLPPEDAEAQAPTPIRVPGASVNAFLFSNGDGNNSPTVPPDTYLQVWGYLEPAHRPGGF